VEESRDFFLLDRVVLVITDRMLFALWKIIKAFNVIDIYGGASGFILLWNLKKLSFRLKIAFFDTSFNLGRNSRSY
jgi:hypothetical protein